MSFVLTNNLNPLLKLKQLDLNITGATGAMVFNNLTFGVSNGIILNTTGSAAGQQILTLTNSLVSGTHSGQTESIINVIGATTPNFKVYFTMYPGEGDPAFPPTIDTGNFEAVTADGLSIIFDVGEYDFRYYAMDDNGNYSPLYTITYDIIASDPWLNVTDPSFWTGETWPTWTVTNPSPVSPVWQRNTSQLCIWDAAVADPWTIGYRPSKVSMTLWNPPGALFLWKLKIMDDSFNNILNIVPTTTTVNPDTSITVEFEGLDFTNGLDISAMQLIPAGAGSTAAFYIYDMKFYVAP